MILKGNRVVLRKIKQEDYNTLWQFIYGEERPEWKKWDAPYFDHPHESFEQFSSNMDKKLAQVGTPTQMIIEVEGKTIGTVGYYWEHEPSRWLEVGITIYEPQHWSGGFGTDALKIWIDYIFKNMELERIGLTTWSGNKRMIRSAEKLGMMMEGRMRKCRYYNGTYYDSIRMGILREEWNNKLN
jgi:RimJ/RimL family protein N-acetyltransferase